MRASEKAGEAQSWKERWVDPILFLALIGMVLFMPAIIDEDRMDRRIEYVQTPDIDRRVVYGPGNESSRAAFAWRDGYVCAEPCID